MYAQEPNRIARKLTVLFSAALLAACGTGDGPESLPGTPATPLPPIPPGFCDVINFEILCPPITIINFNGGATTVIENPDQSGINTSDLVAQMQKFPDQPFGGTLLDTGAPLDFAGDGTVEYKTIGDAPPVGICGSGLLDTLAALLTEGIIDRTGRFRTDGHAGLTEAEDGMQFRLVEASNNHHEIVITQADIDNLIRSKAGVFASIKVLMESTQTKAEDLETVYLAGGFGNFLNVGRAVTIGMLPDVPPEKIQFVGNTSIAGAKTVLLSCKALEATEEIANSMTYFDLMSHQGYMDEFTRANFLPHTDLSLFPSVTVGRV